jgi:hypothetical protein
MRILRPSTVLLAAALLSGAAALGWLQTRTPHLVDRDSYYHARIAHLLPERGLSREFPWAQESVWKDRFSDKDFLFHVVLAPFCRGEDPAAGAKWAAWICGCAVLGALAAFFAGAGFRAPALWLLLVPALGSHFLFRMVEVRGHVLSVALLILGLLALLRDRRRWAFAAGAVYAWTYAAPHLFVVFAAIDALARSAAERRWTWGGLPAAAGGVAAGLVVHPYFPYDLEQWWIINVRILGQAWSLGGDTALRLGEEFQPVFPRSLVVSSTLVFLALLGTAGAGIFRGAALGTRTQRLAAWMLGGFVMYCMSARFIEYFAPLALLAGASAVEDLWPRESPWTRRRAGVAAAAAILALVLGVRALGTAREQIVDTPGPDLAGTARWTRANVPPGETIDRKSVV